MAKNKAAQELGSLGGKARARNMSADELSKAGTKAIRSRWDGMSPEDKRSATEKARRARKKKPCST